MTREEYEERRRAFEEQLRADIALLNAAHEARIRSLDRLWEDAHEGERPTVRTAPSPVPPSVPAPAPKPMSPRYSVVNDLDDVLSQLPTVFDRADIIRALGYTPARTTLFRALNELRREGALEIEAISSGGTKVRYRKLK